MSKSLLVIVGFCVFNIFIDLGISNEAKFVDKDTNLTKITWAHAVNDQRKLSDALNSDIQMIEADIVLGVLVTDPLAKPFPIMGHPPVHISDLSLATFLKTVFEYNQKHKNQTKGIKLDFKSIDVFEQSLDIIQSIYSQMFYPVWINADILSGPIDSQVKPVDPDRFFKGAKRFQDSILSVGWTTRYGEDVQNGSYTDQQITEMVKTIFSNKVTQSVTFPVRAGIAAQSYDLMHKLVDSVDDSTLTIWSSPGDPVNVDELRKLIFSVGLNRTYIDVPEDLRKELHLDEPV